MATAPRPGADRSPADAQQFFRIRLQERTLDVNPSPSLMEKVAVRYATGLPLEAFFNAQNGTIGEDSFAVLWWMGRRQNGEPNLPFATAANEWPTELTEDDLDLAVITVDDEPAEDDSPEDVGSVSSGPDPTSPTSSTSDHGRLSS